MTWSHLDALAGHALGHLFVVGVGLALSSVVGSAIGVLTYRNPTARSWALNSTAVILTIPSLALFAIMLTVPPPIGGLGAKPVIIGSAPSTRSRAAGCRTKSELDLHDLVELEPVGVLETGRPSPRLMILKVPRPRVPRSAAC